MEKKKQNIGYFIAIFLVFNFFVLGILGTNMEIQEDAWYIQSSVDGLFGEDNRSLFVICSHFLFTGLLYLLSLTGIRLFWFNIVLLALIFSLNLINVILIMKKNSGFIGMVFSICFLLFITPITLLTYLNMTIVATYTVITGGMLSIYSIEYNSKALFGVGLAIILFGGCIRIDCLLFALAFLGIYLFVVLLFEIFNKKNGFLQMVKENKSYVLLGIMLLFIVVVLNLSYKISLEYYEPGFLEWNTARANVTDHVLPDYNEFRDEYEKIGVSNNDWELFSTYNSCDTKVYTVEQYNKIDELRKQVISASISIGGICSSLCEVFEKFGKTLTYWSCIGCYFFILILMEKRSKMLATAIVVIMHVLAVYFSITGRFIDRIQASLMISVLVLLFSLIKVERVLNLKKMLASCYILGMIMLWSFPNVGTSYYFTDEGVSYFELYKKSIEKPESLFNYMNNDNHIYYTINNKVSQYISRDNNNLYFVLVSQHWLTNYPLGVVNVFETMEKSSQSNVAFLTGYMTNLSVSKYNCQKYNVDNPFEDLVNKNVKVVLREEELETIGKMLLTYEQEHYYTNCKYKIVDKVEDCVIIQFYICK